jgi:hypothetical protein
MTQGVGSKIGATFGPEALQTTIWSVPRSRRPGRTIRLGAVGKALRIFLRPAKIWTL